MAKFYGRNAYLMSMIKQNLLIRTLPYSHVIIILKSFSLFSLFTFEQIPIWGFEYQSKFLNCPSAPKSVSKTWNFWQKRKNVGYKLRCVWRNKKTLWMPGAEPTILEWVSWMNFLQTIPWWNFACWQVTNDCPQAIFLSNGEKVSKYQYPILLKRTWGF